MKFERICKNYRTREEERRETDLASLLKEYARDGNEEGSGQIERLSSKVNYNAEFLFKIVATLVQKGLLDPVEILNDMVDYWSSAAEEILIDGKSLADIRKERKPKNEEDEF
jgi:hypothetical protein